MEKRDLTINFFKSGSGSISAKAGIPKSWLDKLSITQEARNIELILDEENQQIILKKRD